MSEPRTRALTSERLRELVRYDPETGLITRIETGETLGGDNGQGYLRTKIDGVFQRLHRLAWLYMTGAWPAEFIDHINGIRDDNRWSNLRNASLTANNQNRRWAAQESSTKVLGIIPHGSRFFAQISVAGRTLYLGCFKTPEEAHAAYLAAKRIHHEGCTI